MIVWFLGQKRGLPMNDALANTFVIVGAVTFSTSLILAASRLWRQYKQPTRGEYLIEAALLATEALVRWEQARPFLHHASCPYARHLLETRIRALHYLKTSGIIVDLNRLRAIDEQLEHAYELLGDSPPNLDPPTAGFIVKAARLSVLLQHL